LKKQACLSLNEIHEAIKSNQSISVKILSLIIDDTISSLLRNSQALMSLINLKQYQERLFSHSFNVMVLALTIAIKDGFKKEALWVLGQAALLHDIGWAQLPQNLFGKAKPYTDNELRVVHQHVKLSHHILSQNNDVNEETKELILLHHERSDGSGYPYCKTKHEIKPLARILIVADYYDAMLHGLLDSPGVIAAQALRALYKESLQNKLEGDYVEILIKFLGIYPLWSAVELTSGEKAIVIAINREQPLTPNVKILYSSDGQALVTPVEVELQNDKKNRKIKNLINHVDKNIDPMNILVMATA
ncbi:MAG: HD domain-containing protein, partial [Thiotrichaceae bacterium]|nr:HD domain-containing protein [Thiotrichaceae bacterium]